MVIGNHLENDLEENIGDRPARVKLCKAGLQAWEPCRKNMGHSFGERQKDLYQKYMPIFRNEIWPAKRFLYFRFILTYIFYNQNWIIEFADKIDHLENFWPTPGPYIWRSMLVSLVSNISGCEISSNLLTESTFQDNVHIRRVTEKFRSLIIKLSLHKLYNLEIEGILFEKAVDVLAESWADENLRIKMKDACLSSSHWDECPGYRCLYS